MTTSRRDAAGKTAARFYRWALGAGAAAYSGGMLAEAALGWPLDPRTALLSELAARDRPHRRLFQAGDLLSGSLFALAALARARHAGVRTSGRRLPLYLGLFGAATIADACSPLDYPISQGAGGRAGAPVRHAPSLSHTAHYLTTTVAGTAAAGICLEHHRLQPGGSADGAVRGMLRRAAGPLVIVLLLAGVLTLLSPRLLPGVVQRVQTLAFSVVCLDLASQEPVSPGTGS